MPRQSDGSHGRCGLDGQAEADPGRRTLARSRCRAADLALNFARAGLAAHGRPPAPQSGRRADGLLDDRHHRVTAVVGESGSPFAANSVAAVVTGEFAECDAEFESGVEQVGAARPEPLRQLLAAGPGPQRLQQPGGRTWRRGSAAGRALWRRAQSRVVRRGPAVVRSTAIT